MISVSPPYLHIFKVSFSYYNYKSNLGLEQIALIIIYREGLTYRLKRGRTKVGVFG